MASGATLTVLVVGGHPVDRTNGETAIYDLRGNDRQCGHHDRDAADRGANTAGVDVVFADMAGSAGAGTDDARDGKHSAFGTFTVSAAALTVSKAAAVYSDPFNVSGEIRRRSRAR